MLEVQNLEKSFGGLTAVDGCSLTVEEGSITGLIGPNGAGKTTLFNLITGHYKPDRGKIIFQGEAIESLAPHQIFRKKLYRTFQITREFAQMSVLENLMIMPEHQVGEKIWNTWFRLSHVKEQEKAIVEKALEVLEFVELIDLKNEYAGSLSGGQKKLLEIANYFGWLQDYRKKNTLQCLHYLDMLLKEIGRRAGVSLMEMKYSFPSEIEQILNGKIPNLKERMKKD